jgi:hypothetical protein
MDHVCIIPRLIEMEKVCLNKVRACFGRLIVINEVSVFLVSAGKGMEVLACLLMIDQRTWQTQTKYAHLHEE